MSEDFWDSVPPQETQFARYTDAGSPQWIMKFISAGNAKGTLGERFFESKFEVVEKRHSGDSGHDKTAMNKRLEHKTSAYWKGDRFKWQHIEDTHNWDALILMAIEFHKVVWYFMAREKFEQMCADLGKKVLQGKVDESGNVLSKEGYWCTLDQAKPYLNFIGETDNADITDKVDDGKLRNLLSQL
jgi:hypothetical protein